MNDHFVVAWDAQLDELRLTGFVPGPAGSVTVALESMTVEIDAAEPANVNGITCHGLTASRFDANDTLARLIGPIAAAQAVTLIGHTDRVVRVATDGPERNRFRQRADSRLARLAVAMSAAGAAGMLAVEQALADLDVLTLATAAALAPEIGGLQRRSNDAADLLLADGLGGAVWPHSTRTAIADLLDIAPVADDGRRAALRVLALRVRRDGQRAGSSGGRGGGPALLRLSAERAAGADTASAASVPVAAAMPAAAPKAAVAPTMKPPTTLDSRRPPMVATDSLPELLAGVTPTVRRTSNDEFELRVHGWAGRGPHWWARVFRADGLVPLAAVPVRDDGADLVASVLLAATDLGALEIDIVDDPTAPRQSRQLATFRTAIAIGQRAARLERLGDDATASWHQCATRHQLAGDPWRAELAAARAAGQVRSSREPWSTPLDPVITDLFGPLTSQP